MSDVICRENRNTHFMFNITCWVFLLTWRYKHEQNGTCLRRLSM